MKKIVRPGWATKTFSKKFATFSVAVLCSVFVSALLSQGVFAATGSTIVTVQSTDNEAYPKSLNAWASEYVAIAGLPDGIGGNCKNAPDSLRWGEKECIATYIEGYNDRKNNDVDRGESCNKKKAKATECEKAYDGGAFLANREVRGTTPDLTDTELKTKRDEYCLSKSDDKKAGEISPKEACEKGYNAGYKGQSKESACKNLDSVEDDCKDAYDAGDALARGQDSAPGAGGASTEDIPCKGGAMGWILCPIINYMADTLGYVAGFIDSMMQFKLLLNVESQNQIQTAVGSFTSVANLILVIAFLVIIFSQTTSLGLSNYGIKRMLPRVIITAILINLSFYICAFAIDISNISGNAIMGFITGQGATDASVSKGITDATQLSGPGTVSTVFSTALGAIAGVVLLIMFLGPLVLGVFITFIILVARQVILLFLVLVAPLAFAAWLLPNTESYFKKWKDLFINMLVIYPMLMAIFGIAVFAAKFISQISATSSTAKSGVVASDEIAPLISLLVLAIPLLALPFILRSSNAMLGKIANAAQKYGGQQTSGALGKGVRGAAGRKALDLEARAGNGQFGVGMERAGSFRKRRKYKLDNQARERDRMQDDAVTKFYADNKEKGIDNTARRLAAAGVGGTEGERRMASVLAGQGSARFKEEVGNATSLLYRGGKTTNRPAMLDEVRDAHIAGDAAREAAAMNFLMKTGAGAKEELHTMIEELETDKDGNVVPMTGEQRVNLQQAMEEHGQALKAADPALAYWMSHETASMKTMSEDGKTYKTTDADQLSKMNEGAIARGAETRLKDDDGNDLGHSISTEILQDSLTNENITLNGPQKAAVEQALANRGVSSPGSGPSSGGGTPNSDGGNPPSSGGSSGGGGWNSGGGKSTTEGEIRFTR